MYAKLLYWWYLESFNIVSVRKVFPLKLATLAGSLTHCSSQHSLSFFNTLSSGGRGDPLNTSYLLVPVFDPKSKSWRMHEKQKVLHCSHVYPFCPYRCIQISLYIYILYNANRNFKDQRWSGKEESCCQNWLSSVHVFPLTGLEWRRYQEECYCTCISDCPDDCRKWVWQVIWRCSFMYEGE